METSRNSVGRPRNNSNIIVSLLRSGKTTAARGLIKEAALVVGKNSVAISLLLAESYEIDGRPKMVLRYSQKAYDADRKNLRAALQLSEAFLALGKPGEAVRVARQACRLDRACTKAKLLLARALVGEGKQRECLVVIRRLLLKEPVNVEALMMGGVTAHLLGEFKQALWYFERLIPRYQGDGLEDKVLLYQLTADSAFSVGSMGTAKRSYRAVLKLCPSDRRSIWGLAACYLFEGNAKKAKLLRKAFVAGGELSGDESRALKELDETLAAVVKEWKHEQRLEGKVKFLDAANALLEEVGALVGEYVTTLERINVAIEKKQLSACLPLQKDSEGRELNERFQSEIRKVCKAWAGSEPLSRVTRQGEQALRLGRELVVVLRVKGKSGSCKEGFTAGVSCSRSLVAWGQSIPNRLTALLFSRACYLILIFKSVFNWGIGARSSE